MRARPVRTRARSRLVTGPDSRRWAAVAVLAAAYLVVGLVFGELAGRAATQAGRISWRWAAWAVSAVLFLVQLWYHRVRLGDGRLKSAFHVALASAVGAGGLAVAALVHALASGTGNPRLLAIALVAWPAVTMVPAFLVALAAAALGPNRSST